jgi:reductive dehalogenase
METEKKQESTSDRHSRFNRRQFMKIGSAGAVMGALEMANVPAKIAAAATEKEDEKTSVKALDEFPIKISDDYKPFPQKNTVFSRAVDNSHKTLGPAIRTFERYDCDDSKPGFTRTDWALHHGAWAIEHAATPGSKFGMPSSGWYNWQQKSKKERTSFLDLDYVYDTQHKFASKAEAADAIKRAARLYGADLVGITYRNPKWDYAKHYNALAGEEISWDKFPFEPKSVIVIALEMDYESIATAPSYTLEGAIGAGYSDMAKVAYQVSVFLKCLGYKTVAAGNDLGLSVPYAIQAGLGEGARNGLLVTYKYGPRVRICKVYTELDFVEYDKPVSFGARNFCEHCQRCADACPAKAIPKNIKPTMAPTHDNPEKWFNNPGVEKWYLNAKSCFEYWVKGNNSCGTCIASCPYNKPDFWHHRLVDKLNAALPGPVHSFMREMDIVFGYGNTFDDKAVKKFWSSKNKKYLGF